VADLGGVNRLRQGSSGVLQEVITGVSAEVNSRHFIQAEQPDIVADRVRHLLDEVRWPAMPSA
jgi:hypothetical protein